MQVGWPAYFSISNLQGQRRGASLQLHICGGGAVLNVMCAMMGDGEKEQLSAASCEKQIGHFPAH